MAYKVKDVDCHIYATKTSRQNTASIIIEIDYIRGFNNYRHIIHYKEKISNDCFTLMNHAKDLLKNDKMTDDKGINLCKDATFGRCIHHYCKTCFDSEYHSFIKITNGGLFFSDGSFQYSHHNFIKNINNEVYNFIDAINKNQLNRLIFVVLKLCENPFNIPDYLLFIILKYCGISIKRKIHD
jgi:hypothetical protein